MVETIFPTPVKHLCNFIFLSPPFIKPKEILFVWPRCYRTFLDCVNHVKRIISSIRSFYLLCLGMACSILMAWNQQLRLFVLNCKMVPWEYSAFLQGSWITLLWRSPYHRPQNITLLYMLTRRPRVTPGIPSQIRKSRTNVLLSCNKFCSGGHSWLLFFSAML